MGATKEKSKKLKRRQREREKEPVSGSQHGATQSAADESREMGSEIERGKDSQLPPLSRLLRRAGTTVAVFFLPHHRVKMNNLASILFLALVF